MRAGSEARERYQSLERASGTHGPCPAMKRLVFAVVLSCCSASGVYAQDTVVVRADNRPVWGSEPRLVEEVRLGGLDDPLASFGHVAGIAIDERGVIWVADGQSAEVRRFSSDGRFLGMVGRKGEGPGEFGGISGIKRMPDGRMVVWDAHQGRFSFFADDGSFSGSARRYVGVLGGPSEVFQVDTAGYLYLLWMWSSKPPGPARGVWYKLAADGTLVDSVEVPPSGRRVMGGRAYPFGAMGPFSPVTMSALSPHGYLVVAKNDNYTISRPLPDGRTLRIVRSWDPIRLQRGERSQYRQHAAHVAALWEGYGFSNDIPAEKPPFWAIRVDEEARLWVARHNEGVFLKETEGERARRRELAQYRGSEPPPLEWWEPLVVDVIEPTGRFLGTLRFPSNRFAIMSARGRQVWAIEVGENDEQYVVRFRIEGN